MSNFYFEHNMNPFLFDTELLKLFQIKYKKLIEIDNREFLRDIGLNALEISRDRAFKLAEEIMKGVFI